VSQTVHKACSSIHSTITVNNLAMTLTIKTQLHKFVSMYVQVHHHCMDKMIPINVYNNVTMKQINSNGSKEDCVLLHVPMGF